jgi:ribosomal protein S18 acetylase RimI-like enzyme
MSTSMIEIAYNRADAARVAAHLRACDGSFVPSLSTRVELEAYAAKIAQFAERTEAWSGAQLAGLVAAYANDPERRTAFITSVSVLPAWHGQGLASKLLLTCIARVRGLGYEGIELEVDVRNTAATQLYRKHGFVVQASHDQTHTLRLVN